MSGRATELLGNFGHSARQGEAKASTRDSRVHASPDVHPANTPRPARAHGFHEGLFCRKAERKLGRVAPETAAVRDFSPREDPLFEALAASGEKALDARDLDHVDAASDDHRPPVRTP